MNRNRRHKKNDQWASAAARRLLELAEQPPTIEDAVRIVATKYLDEIPYPPTDLTAFAERVGVTEICGEDLPVSGELRRNGKRLKVVYSNYLSEERRRFTIAHELGHAIFENSGARPPRTGEELERLCDMLASEILLPHEAFLSCTAGSPSVQNLLETSQKFKTSLTATSIRYAKAKNVSIFHIESSRITWGYGAIKKGSLNELSYSLRLTVEQIMTGKEITDQLLFITPRGERGEWRLDYQTMNGDKRALFMLIPKTQKEHSHFVSTA